LRKGHQALPTITKGIHKFGLFIRSLLQYSSALVNLSC